ncbi:MAG TPA: carboxypeptidase-like regulatory domain-containing protein [Candidatus Acidoferrales bacterium]|nr:carboxypeptidase-like regulatory domain-containing protein [Candidatus Acidoferrales bacterium]
MVKRVLPLFSVLAIALLLAPMMFAQNPTGNMTGTVLDAQGAAIVGANIEVKDSTTGAVAYKGQSGADGHFLAANLPPGVYTVTVTQSGFNTGVFNDIKITVGQTYDLPAKLEVGQINTVVNVEGGGAQVIETQNTSVSSVVSGKAITNLPFVSRSAVLLGVLDPGAQTSGGSRNTTFEGLPKGAINITFDGINIQDNTLKSNDGFFAINDPRVDDVDEFQITDAGNSVDKAGEGAIQMNYVSKRGGNAWHGGAWETFRNTYLDSNYYFNKENNLPRQILQMNDFGYKIGGPIFKDKLFFFTDFDFFQLPQSIARSRNILTPAAAGGTFTYTPTCTPGSAGCVGTGAVNAWTTCNAAADTCAVNMLSMAANNGFPSAIDPTVNKFLTAVQSAQAASGVTTSTSCSNCNPLWQQQINFNAHAMGTRRYPDLRLDYNLTQHHSLEFDYHYAHYNSSPDILNSVDATYPVAPFNANQGAQLSNRNLLVAAWRWTIGSTASNELRVGVQLAPVNFGLGVSPSFYPTINTNLGQVTTRFGITGVSSFFLSPGNTQGRNAALGEILDNFTWTKGSHNLAFGFTETDIHYNDFFVESSSTTFGIASGDPAAKNLFSSSNVPNIGSTDLGSAEGLYASLTGRVSSFSNNIAFDPKSGNFKIGAPLTDRINQLELGAYVSDSWRFRPTLTLNYGVRWQYDGPPQDKLNEYFMLNTGYAGLYDVSGLGNLFKPGTISGVVPTFVNDAGQSWWNKYWKAFAPNVGFAWSPNIDHSWWKAIFGGAGKSVIRSSFSIAYDREGINNFSSVAGGNPGYTGSQTSSGANIAAGSPATGQFPAGSLLFAGGNLPDVLQTPSTFSSSFPLTAASGAAVNAFNPNLKPGMVESWTFGLQRELGSNQVLEVRYVGNHGVGLWRQYNLNEINVFENGFVTEFNNALNNLNICTSAAQAANCLTAEKANGFASAATTKVIPSFANLGLAGQVNVPIMTGAFTGSQTGSQANSNFGNSTLVSDLQLGTVGSFANSINTLANWNNLQAAGYPSNFFMVAPDARGGSFAMDNATQSTYNGLILDFRRRQAKGLYFDVNYAYSKSLTNYYANSSVDFAGFTTLRDRGYDKGPAPFDIRHAIKGQLLYELPFGEGKRWAFHSTLANRLIGGWQINSITRWQTGPPIQITSGVGGTFNSADPGINLIGITGSQLQSLLTTNKVEQAGTVFYVPTSLLDAKLQRANTNILQPCFVAGSLCSKQFVWGPQFFRADISLVKETKITERVSLELRAEMLNALNDADFYWACTAGSSACAINTQSTSFGKMAGAYQDFNTTQDPGGRVLQLIARVNF